MRYETIDKMNLKEYLHYLRLLHFKELFNFIKPYDKNKIYLFAFDSANEKINKSFLGTKTDFYNHCKNLLRKNISVFNFRQNSFDILMNGGF